jgi:hypothetical protein
LGRRIAAVPESKSPLEQALDLFVYAPLGLALTAREEMPKLAEKGRQRVTGQVMMAKMMGQFAVAQGQKEAEKAVKRFTASPAPAVPAPAAAAASPAPAPAVSVTSTPSSAASANGSSNGSANGGGLPPVGDLAIPGYDSLSASQVVQRLAGLSGEELEAVARYESATRHRKTILTRISQLQ